MPFRPLMLVVPPWLYGGDGNSFWPIGDPQMPRQEFGFRRASVPFLLLPSFWGIPFFTCPQRWTKENARLSSASRERGILTRTEDFIVRDYEQPPRMHERSRAGEFDQATVT